MTISVGHPMLMPSNGVVNFTFSDFGGSVGYPSQKSIVFNDKYFSTRYNIFYSNPPDSESISGDNFNLVTAKRSVQQQGGFYCLTNGAFDEDFLFEIDMTISNVDGPTPETTRFSPGAGIYLNVNGTLYILSWLLNTDFTQGIQYSSDSGSSYTLNEVNNTGGNWVLGIGRIGSTLTFYKNSSSIATVASVTGNVSGLCMFVNNNNGSGNTGWETDFTLSKLNVAGVEYTEKRIL